MEFNSTSGFPEPFDLQTNIELVKKKALDLKLYVEDQKREANDES